MPAEGSKGLSKSEPQSVAATAVESIPVYISYEIIRLFSEGLYQSPHKAIEELVSNSYDAGARFTHVLLPEESDDPSEPLPNLWVIDNGHGMDIAGFQQLWRVAESAKADVSAADVPRPPIGQFGIGKLAAYVLAWKLIHISKANGAIHCAEMNFRDIIGKHQADGAPPHHIGLFNLSEEQARAMLFDVESRSPEAWSLLFGEDAAPTWTAAAMSDFKNLYDRLSSGTLGWVLRTGLPLHADFQIWLNGQPLSSAKESKKTIMSVDIGGSDDTAADRMSIRTDGVAVEISGIPGIIKGKARIFEERLTTGKSEQYGRSHGFFIRVRGRVINLEDELFGLDALNHAAWSRFAMEIDADGLREHLLSSREGVRESEPIRKLREYLLAIFNICRVAYDAWADKQLVGLDIEDLLRDAPSLFVTEPLFDSVKRALETAAESFYLAKPEAGGTPEDQGAWLEGFSSSLDEGPFSKVLFEQTGEYDRALRYVPDSRTLIINVQHPFIDKLLSAGGRSRGAATLFGSSEVLMDALLQDHGVRHADLMELMKDRDRILRLLAGDQPSTAGEVLRRLQVANRDHTALERAVGLAFRVLGFEYQRRGGNDEGPDGVLYARLGRDSDSLADYKIVYDTKQTNGPSVPADKINIDSIDDFRKAEDAHFAFFVAVGYAAQDDPDGKLNRLVREAVGSGRRVTLLRIDDIRRIVELHYRFGVTLTHLRNLFATAHTVPEVREWVDDLERELTDLEPPVPLRRLLEGLERAKVDEKARPNIHSVRALDEQLRLYEPEKLVSALRAVATIAGKRWIEVDSSSLDIKLHHNAERILEEVERNLNDLFGTEPTAGRP